MATKAGLFFVALKYLSIFWIAGSKEMSLTTLCKKLCPGPLSNSSVVKDRCGAHAILDRCCMNSSATLPYVNTDVIGIDLSGCDVHTLNNSLQLLRNVLTVVLQNNPLREEAIGQEEFYGLSKMDYLSLPSGLTCPGGNSSWEIENSTLTQTLCEWQIDQCHLDNFTCPDKSYCVERGPGLKDCLCSEGYHGYKCLKSGHFPTEWFLIGLASTSAAVCAFLWITQRRHTLSKKSR